jgi:thioredoxin 1
VQKSKSKAKPKAAAVSTKAPAKPKTGALCPKPPPKATSTKKTPAGKPQDQKKPAKPAPTVLPRLVDLGATKCIPCKMMAPILEELAKEYKGKLKVEFIDVWEKRDAGEKYGIRVIPTQIFFDRKGKEFFRHEGFYPKEDILRKFKDQGIELGK